MRGQKVVCSNFASCTMQIPFPEVHNWVIKGCTPTSPGMYYSVWTMVDIKDVIQGVSGVCQDFFPFFSPIYGDRRMNASGIQGKQMSGDISPLVLKMCLQHLLKFIISLVHLEMNGKARNSFTPVICQMSIIIFVRDAQCWACINQTLTIYGTDINTVSDV